SRSAPPAVRLPQCFPRRAQHVRLVHACERGCKTVSHRDSRASDAKPSGPVIVSVCTTCRLSADDIPRVGARMLEALKPVIQAQTPDVKVRSVQCLGVCKRPATIA